MAYCKFENVEEILNEHINQIIIKRLQLRDFKPLKYNCHKSNKDKNNKCFYDGCCRVSCIIYELECKLCNKKYIGNTQYT